MASGKGISGWLERFRQKRKAPKVEAWGAPQQVIQQPIAFATIGRNQFAFGLEWQFYASQKELTQTKRFLRRNGASHYAVQKESDSIGYGASGDKSLGKKAFSAALHLAETVSLGGVEIFIFELPDGLFSLIALSDSHPVPNFDQVVNSSDEIMTLVAEYQALQGGQPIRFVGNTALIETNEKLTLNEAFARPDGTASLLALPNYKLIALVLVTVVPAVLVVAAAGAWMEYERQEAEKARLAQEQDPNYIYENQVGPAMQQTGLQAQITLDRWRETVFRIPTDRMGWKLEKITCKPTQCTVTWLRDFGSYHDFHGDPLQGMASSSEIQNGESPAKANIQTVLTVPTLPNEAKGLVREKLPDVRPTLQDIASQLQDLSLLQEAVVKLKQPELYPSTGASIDQINRPVAKGEWSISHELWTLGELNFDAPTLVVESLSIEQDAKTKNWTYTLTGHYYAKGKKF